MKMKPKVNTQTQSYGKQQQQVFFLPAWSRPGEAFTVIGQGPPVVVEESFPDNDGTKKDKFWSSFTDR